jgi:hypothetical protein
VSSASVGATCCLWLGRSYSTIDSVHLATFNFEYQNLYPVLDLLLLVSLPRMLGECVASAVLQLPFKHKVVRTWLPLEEVRNPVRRVLWDSLSVANNIFSGSLNRRKCGQTSPELPNGTASSSSPPPLRPRGLHPAHRKLQRCARYPSRRTRIRRGAALRHGQCPYRHLLRPSPIG